MATTGFTAKTIGVARIQGWGIGGPSKLMIYRSDASRNNNDFH